MRRILFFALVLMLLNTTCGCTTRYIEKNDSTQAISVTPEMLEEISREILKAPRRRPRPLRRPI